MDKLLSKLIPVFFVTVFSGTLTGTVSAETPLDPWGTSSPETIEAADLADLSGRDNFTNVQSIQELEASVSNGSFTADTITTGAITIEQNAFKDYRGSAAVVINTGHHNAFNSAIGISIYLTE